MPFDSIRVHVLPWGELPDRIRQIVSVTDDGVVSFFNVAPGRRLFSLTPAFDAEIQSNQYRFDKSELSCAPGGSMTKGCWLSLNFALIDKLRQKHRELSDGEYGGEHKDVFPENRTVVYHFPRMLPDKG
jgi:hypothetical protein